MLVRKNDLMILCKLLEHLSKEISTEEIEDLHEGFYSQEGLDQSKTSEFATSVFEFEEGHTNMQADDTFIIHDTITLTDYFANLIKQASESDTIEITN